MSFFSFSKQVLIETLPSLVRWMLFISIYIPEEGFLELFRILLSRPQRFQELSRAPGKQVEIWLCLFEVCARLIEMSCRIEMLGGSIPLQSCFLLPHSTGLLISCGYVSKNDC